MEPIYDIMKKEIIEKTVTPTDEPNKNNAVYKFMLDEWNNILKENEALWQTPYTPKQMETILEWFNGLDKRFKLEEGTVLHYYKWASRYRYVSGYDRVI